MLVNLVLAWCCFSSIVVAVTFRLTNLQGVLTNNTGLLRSLSPVSDPDLDFSINGFFDARNGDGNYHTGDVSLRYRFDDQTAWTAASTASNRSIPLEQLSADKDTAISSWDLSEVFQGSGLNVTRTWASYNGDLVLTVNLTNIVNQSIEVGGLVFPLEVNNIFTGKEAANVLQECSFIDPYIGLDAGYAQVTRLNGLGPNMIITPFIRDTQFEAWNFLQEPSGSLEYQSNYYEGNYEWLVHTKAYADDEWIGVQPWNTPTSLVLQAQETASFGLRFTVVPSVADIESYVAGLGQPVAVGLPGYILPRDLVGNLYINSSIRPLSVKVSPENALNISDVTTPPKAPWIGYSVTPGDQTFGRALVTISYPDNYTQTLHYWVTDESTTVINNVGQHISTKQWYTNTSDPFRRAPSIISYDKEQDTFILQDNRTWIAGLSDEGGTGSFVTLAIKQIIQPVSEEINKLETFVNETVWGTLQHSNRNDTYAVKKSLFYYDPSVVPEWHYDPWFNWTQSWNESLADVINRAYDYVWVSLLYWALYKADRVSPGILSIQEPTWYLQKAFETVHYGLGNNSQGMPNTILTYDGLMGESVWGHLLSDLQNENLTSETDSLRAIFQQRQANWTQSADPFGSEMPWDCTGQEGVHFWSQYFNDSTTALKVIQSIHGFDPTIAHWGWNGNARRYWDFTTAGNPNTSRIERQIHHYGSSLNAIPLLDYYRRNETPNSLESLYSLRVGYGGHLASLSNVDQNGFTSMAFHSFPNTLEWDTYTGDYGPSFVGHFQTSASYLVQHPEFGWTAFGGNTAIHGGSNGDDVVTVTPVDTLRRRAYVAPLGLYIVFEAGRIQNYAWNDSAQTLDLTVGSDNGSAQQVILWFEQTSSVIEPRGVALGTKGLREARGGYVVDIPKNGLQTLQWVVKTSS